MEEENCLFSRRIKILHFYLRFQEVKILKKLKKLYIQKRLCLHVEEHPSECTFCGKPRIYTATRSGAWFARVAREDFIIGLNNERRKWILTSYLLGYSVIKDVQNKILADLCTLWMDSPPSCRLLP